MYNRFILLYSRNTTVQINYTLIKLKKKKYSSSHFQNKLIIYSQNPMYFSFHSLFPSGGNRHPQARKPYTDLQCNMEEGCSGEVCKQPWGPRRVEIIVRLGG